MHLAQLESKADIAARHLPILEQNLAKLRADGLTEESAQVKYHNAQIETFRADLDAAKLNDPTRQTTTPEPLKGMKAKKKDPKPATAGGGGSGGGRGGGGGNGRGGRGVQSPDGDGNDPQATLRVLKARAQDAEPAASVMVRGVGAETGGTVERFASRFKADASILEKLKRFRQNRPPHYRMDKFNDALRYTLVFDPDSYWQSTRRVVTEIERHGFTVVLDPGGWRTNYQGLNLTVRDEAGRIFEVQLHTAASLRASEQSHGLYEQWRKLKHGDPRRSVLEAQIAAIYEHVPWPPGVPRV